MNIVIFFSGTGTNLESILKHQNDYKYKVIGAFTNNPKLEEFKYAKDIIQIAKLLIMKNIYVEKILIEKY